MVIAKQEFFFCLPGNGSGVKMRTLVDGCFCLEFEVIKRNLTGFGFSSERNT